MDEDLWKETCRLQTQTGRGEEEAWTAHVKRLHDFSDPNRL